MLAPEFVVPYDETLDHSLSGPMREVMEAARGWSHTFGQILHMRLTDPGGDLSGAMDLYEEYFDWCDNPSGLVSALKTVKNDTSPEGLKARNELNFHYLNSKMAPLWAPIIEGLWKEPEGRKLALATCQDLVAYGGLLACMDRQAVAGPKTSYYYFSEPNEDARKTFEGMVNEMDLAIVLMEICKHHPSWTVVPGPMQFEHGRNPSLNADFIIYDQDGYAIGVQGKGMVRNEHAGRQEQTGPREAQRETAVHEPYDKNRIVLVDARVDMANQLATRTREKDVRKRVVSWAGLICLEHVKTSKTTGARSSYLEDIHGGHKNLMNHIGWARYTLGPIKPSKKTAVERIEPRIMTKLRTDLAA